MTWVRTLLPVVFLSLLCFFLGVPPAMAQDQVMGIHILSTGEVKEAAKLLSKNGNEHFVTVPFTLQDLNKRAEWEAFFAETKAAKLKPIVRLATRVDNSAWQIPTRSDIMAMTRFLSSIDWKSDELHVVLFNEPNHAKEWGNTLDPEGFARLTNFTVDWLKTEQKRYIVLPAGLDLAAPNGKDTMEAFTYLKRVIAAEPELLEKFDGWTSHSYPNPAFSSSPRKTDKTSLRGYQHELTFLRQYTHKEFPIYITETGWDHSEIRPRTLKAYFQEAYTKIWNTDTRIRAVTPFLLQGAPGVFASFSMLDASGQPTHAYEAYQSLFSDKN